MHSRNLKAYTESWASRNTPQYPQPKRLPVEYRKEAHLVYSRNVRAAIKERGHHRQVALL